MQRQPDPKSCSASDLAFQFNAAAVSAHDSLHDHQTQAGAFFFGGIEWFKDPINLLLWNTAPGIGHAHPNPIRSFAGLQRKRPGLGHRLYGVWVSVADTGGGI